MNKWTYLQIISDSENATKKRDDNKIFYIHLYIVCMSMKLSHSRYISPLSFKKLELKWPKILSNIELLAEEEVINLLILFFCSRNHIEYLA